MQCVVSEFTLYTILKMYRLSLAFRELTVLLERRERVREFLKYCIRSRNTSQGHGVSERISG